MPRGRPKGIKNDGEEKNPEHKIKIQFDFSPQHLKMLDTLVDNTGASTRAEIVRASVNLYHKILSECSKGSAFGFVLRDGTFRELLLPHQIEVEVPIVTKPPTS
jgi:hypothetical protein